MPVTSHEVSESFAKFFEEKVSQIVCSTRGKPSVHNGTRKMDAEDSVFMTGNKINECIMDQKLKNMEGYDRIPQRILIDGRVYILNNLILLNWLNMSRDTYKVHCKKLLLNCKGLWPVV